MNGTLYGVGVGPGDPELMTLKAVRLIRACGVIAVPDSGAEQNVERCGMEGERVYRSLEETGDELSYFSMLVIKE